MRSVLQAIEEGFAFISTAEAAAEVAYSIVITQGQCIPIPQNLTDLRWVTLVSVRVGKVELIQYSDAIVIAGIKRMGF